jgi:ubiquinone/menaquinone biosynthesis C-methylase UbiE
VAFAFRQLYTRFAWAYDGVSWAVSRGRWQEWGQAALPRLAGRRVLEIGCGPGHLLAAMAAAGYHVSAVELSPQMVRQARNRLRRGGLAAELVRGRAQALPWPAGVFDNVVMTFPAGFVLDPRTVGEVWRVLRPGGRLIIVDSPRLHRGVYALLVNIAFWLTGGRGGLHSLEAVYRRAGFDVVRETETWPDSTVEVLVITKTSGPLSAP